MGIGWRAPKCWPGRTAVPIAAVLSVRCFRLGIRRRRLATIGYPCLRVVVTV